ncbi:hypothetical protein NGRA_0498 [Nosema granulosis]|uniref:Uncharacterized protein n=1 Tax=Nosema granulosis TaxID=83296 RepID=A0A9P6H096_9MICR|nr:hypothetical protein NGRA_0498 [Nosema granulosis]
MENKENKGKKYEDDEYSILKGNVYGEESMLKWKSFHKNVNTTIKSYNLDGILRDDTYVSRKHENLDSNNSYIQKDSLKNPILDDNSVLKESNISLKRYLESIKTGDTKKESTKNISVDCKKINNSKVFHEISQIKDDLEKCTNLLKRKKEIEENSFIKRQKDTTNIGDSIISEKKTKTEEKSFIKRQKDKTTICEENTIKDKATIGDTLFLNRNVKENSFLKKQKENLDINLFHSTLIETKKRIDKAIEETQEKEIQEPNENNDKLPEMFVKKIEEHIKVQKNYKKEINSLEKTNKLQNLEILMLKSKIKSINSREDVSKFDKYVTDGKSIIKELKNRLVSVEEDTKTKLQRAFADNKILESEIMGLKKIINKLVDKIRDLKKSGT